MGDTSRALQTIADQLVHITSPSERRAVQEAAIPMYAIGSIGISKGEMVFDVRYDRTTDPNAIAAQRRRRPTLFGVGVTSKYFRGASRRCAAYVYRSDGTIVATSDEDRGQPYGEKYTSGSVISVHLNLTRRELSFYVDGRCQGVAFVFNPVEDPEPLFPLVLLESDGDTGTIQPPRSQQQLR